MIVSTVSTTILTATPILLPRGLRVNILMSATAETGPAVDVTYRQSETEAIGGLVVVPLVLHVTPAASYGYLLIDVANDAPLGEATLVVDQVGFDQKELAVPVNVVAETGPWWEFVGPQNFGTVPVAGRVTAVAYDPNARDTLYAGAAAGGLWRSTDSGDTWVPLTDWCSAEPLYVSTIAFDPFNAVIYVGSGGRVDLIDNSDGSAINYPMGVFCSSDAGRTWSPVGRELFGESAISKVFVDPRYPELIWVAPATPGPVCQSVDGGDTWTKVEALPSAKWTGMERAPAIPDRYYLVGEGAPQLWRTDDGGVEWVRLRGPFSAIRA